MMRLSDIARVAYIAAHFVVAGAASAQDAPLPVPRPEPREFILNLNEQEVLYIASALRELPYKDVSALLNKIQIQINEQSEPAAPGKSEDAGADDSPKE